MSTVKFVSALVAIIGYFAIAVPFIAWAQDPESNNYRFEETTLGNGGLIDSASPSYQSGVSIGDTAIGNSASSNFQVEAGSQTTDDPALRFVINESNVQFGAFSTSAATTATSTFTVTNYTSYGYVVHIIGDAPSNGAHTIDPLTTTSASITGQEQFGINLVANTSPASFGANPDLGDFGSGAAATNYDVPNQYRFVSGEAIAGAAESSGAVTYTISYIINVEGLTPGGQYTTNHTLICTGTY